MRTVSFRECQFLESWRGCSCFRGWLEKEFNSCKQRSGIVLTWVCSWYLRQILLWYNMSTLQGANISHTWKRKIMLKSALGRDRLVPRRYTILYIYVHIIYKWLHDIAGFYCRSRIWMRKSTFFMEKNGCFFGRTLVWSMTLISPNISMMVCIGWLYYKTFGSNPPWEIKRRIQISPTCPTILWTSKTGPGSVASLTHPTSQACGRRATGTGYTVKREEISGAFLEASGFS